MLDELPQDLLALLRKSNNDWGHMFTAFLMCAYLNDGFRWIEVAPVICNFKT